MQDKRIVRCPPQLAGLLSGGSVAHLSDAELLDRFVTQERDVAEVAFAALIQRHGPMVQGVCRRVLTDPADADDAFQATFLLLVRKAGSVRVGDSLGRWLYGVSRKVAARARTNRTLRLRRERAAPVPDQPDHDPGTTRWAAQLALLDAEVARLAEPFRSAILLCDLGGRTHEQAALEIGCPVGTIKSRLARGRERLRDRLGRQGVTGREVDLASLAVLTGGRAVSSTLIASVTAAAVQVGKPVLPVGPVVGAGWNWTFWKGFHAMMLTLPYQWITGSALVVALGSASWVGMNGPNPQDPPTQVAPPASPPAASGAAPSSTAPRPASDLPREMSKVVVPDYVVEPPDIIIVEVMGGLDGRPIAGERLVRPDGRISLGFYGDVYVAGLTLTEIKEKVVLTLRKHLSDDQLGIAPPSPSDSVPLGRRLAEAKRVFVDVTSYNSKVYYVQGCVDEPGRFPITGNETVLDAVHFSGLLFRDLGRARVILTRPDRTGTGLQQTLPVNLKAIVEHGETRTNYQVMPGDRITVLSEPPLTEIEFATLRTNHKLEAQQLRLDQVEQKLDRILRRLEALDKTP